MENRDQFFARRSRAVHYDHGGRNLVVEEVAGAILEDDSDSDFIDNFEYNGSRPSSAMSTFDDWFEVEAEAKNVPANIIKRLFEPYDPSNYKKRRGKDE